MKIIYDEHNRVSEIIFAEGEDQKAFWDAYKAREKEITERCKTYNEKDVAIEKEITTRNTAIEKEITTRNKNFINIQFGYMGYNGLSNIN